MKKLCINCNKSFTPYKPTSYLQKYCSKLCYRKFNGLSSAYKNVSGGTVGAIAELEISSDLMKKGFEVYRALSPASSCDILAIKDKKIYTLEVRTGYRTSGGSLAYSKENVRAEIIAIFIHRTKEIIYRPDL